MDFLQQVFLGNTLRSWLTALLVFGASLALLRLLERLVLHRMGRYARRTVTYVDDLVAAVLGKTKGFFYLAVALWAGVQFVGLPARLEGVVEVAAILALLVQAGIWSAEGITYYVTRYRQDVIEEDAGAATTMAAVGFVGRLVVWSVILLLALDNLGIDVTALIAGLGVGGIAVALAVQNVLGDLFASLAIVLDKPFVIGDFLILGDHMGTVEHVGLKTTRIRSLSGEQLIFSNQDLLSSRIRNYGRMRERRVVFQIGVTYGTSRDDAARIPEMIRQALEKHDQVRVDRCHFKEFGDSALVYETVYYVEDPAYNVYMEIQQAANLELLERFREEGIEFAYPTRTVIVEASHTPGGGSSGVVSMGPPDTDRAGAGPGGAAGPAESAPSAEAE